MYLTEFASLLSNNDTNTAKNTLSYLIGNGLNNSNWNKALAHLYKSFPTSIKESEQQKKEFFPIIVKYFYTYTLNEDNKDIFDEYIHFFSAAHKDYIKEINPNWIFKDNFDITFKNTLEFSRAIPRNSDEVFDFMNTYKNQLENFINIPKNKIKLLENFDKNSIWIKMIECDYSSFSDFCNNYNFDKYEILNNYIQSYIYFSNTSVIKEKNIDLFLSDISIIGKSSLNKEKFYPNQIISNNNDNVLSLLLNIINQNEFISAIKYIKFFEPELNNYAKLLNIKVKDSVLSKDSLQQIYDIQKNYQSSYYVNLSLKQVIENDNWFGFFNNYFLMNELESELDKKPEINNKKMKI